MTAVSAPTPSFSHMMAQEREGSNGLEINHAISEFIDNSFDAGARKCYIALVSVPGTSKHYLVISDTGEGLTDPLVLYSTSRTGTVKKPAGSRGLKNYGYRAAIGRLSPTSIFNIGRKVGSRASTLKLLLGSLYAAIDRANTAGRCNYHEIDRDVLPEVQHVSIATGLNDEAYELLDEVLASMRAPSRDYGELTATLQNIRNNAQPSYCLHIMGFDTLPADLETQIVEAFKSYKLTYYKDLVDHELEFFGAETPHLHYTAADACDPLGPATVPRLSCKLEFRIPEGADVKTAPHFIALTLTDPTTSATATFYATCTAVTQEFQDGKGAGSPFTSTAPAEWELAIQTSTQMLQISVPSNDVAKDIQENALGSSLYSSVEDMRGVYIRYVGRILGKPVYNPRWEDPRNIGALRVELSADDQETAEKYWAIQTRKHVAGFDNLHKPLKFALNWIVNNIIIKKRLHTKHGLRGRGVADWRFASLCQLMLNQRLVETVPVPSISVLSHTLPDPDPATTDESDAESEASASSGSSAAAALAEEVPTIVHKGEPAPAPAPAPAPVPVVAHARAAPAAGPTPKEIAQNILLLKDLLSGIPEETLTAMLANATPIKNRNLKTVATSISTLITMIPLCESLHHT
jgi:hypothetical protein